MRKSGKTVALLLAACAGMTFSLQAEEPAVKKFSIQCGDLTLKFDGAKFWNPNRIDFQGRNVAVEIGGVHYGAVGNFKGDKGFVGSGHKETGVTEIVNDYSITVDGQPLALSSLTEGGTITAQKEFSVVKKSAITQLDVDYTLKVANNVMEESYTLRTGENTDLNMVYLFMHPWKAVFDHFTIDSSDPIALKHDGKFPANRPGKSVTFSSKSLNLEICSTLLENAPEGKTRHLVWDRKGDTKHYLMLWKNDTMLAGKDYNFAMRTEFRKTADQTPVANAELPAPARFPITCGDLSFVFDKAKFYYANRVDYKGKNISIDSRGVHYGAVIKYKDGKGFIGSGHKETGVAERVLEYAVSVDSNDVPASTIGASGLKAEKEFSIRKKSLLNNVEVEYIMQVTGNVMKESYLLKTPVDSAFNMVYLFMHPWTATFETFTVDGGAPYTTKHDGKFPFGGAAKTITFLSNQANVAVTSTILEADPAIPIHHLIWDRQGDTKHYLRVWHNKIMDPGKEYRFVMETSVKDLN